MKVIHLDKGPICLSGIFNILIIFRYFHIFKFRYFDVFSILDKVFWAILDIRFKNNYCI